MAQSWLKKYEPQIVEHIHGQDRAIKELSQFLTDFKAQKKRSCLLIGPVGCGKTVSAIVLAKKMGADVIEVNASDTRNADQIESLIGAASKQMSLFFRPKVILIDEVDGVSGQQDRGGIPALVKVIDETSFPIVMTATDVDDSKFSPLKKAAKIIQFDLLSPEAVSHVLNRICEGEQVLADPLALSSLSRRCGGDLRAAVNDLQSLSQETHTLTREIVDQLDDRNKVESIENALIKVFKVSDAKVANTAFDAVAEDPDECLLWVEENLPKEYEDPASLARAFDCLSKADVFRGRIRRWQHWRFLVYQFTLMSAGIAVSKDERKRLPVDYVRSKRLLSIYILNMKHAKRKAIAKKIAEHNHGSVRQVLQDTLPYLRVTCKKDAGFLKNLTEECELDDEEVEWLTR